MPGTGRPGKCFWKFRSIPLRSLRPGFASSSVKNHLYLSRSSTGSSGSGSMYHGRGRSAGAAMKGEGECKNSRIRGGGRYAQRIGGGRTRQSSGFILALVGPLGSRRLENPASVHTEHSERGFRRATDKRGPGEVVGHGESHSRLGFPPSRGTIQILAERNLRFSCQLFTRGKNHWINGSFPPPRWAVWNSRYF